MINNQNEYNKIILKNIVDKDRFTENIIDLILTKKESFSYIIEGDFGYGINKMFNDVELALGSMNIQNTNIYRDNNEDELSKYINENMAIINQIDIGISLFSLLSFATSSTFNESISNIVEKMMEDKYDKFFVIENWILLNEGIKKILKHIISKKDIIEKKHSIKLFFLISNYDSIYVNCFAKVSFLKYSNEELLHINEIDDIKNHDDLLFLSRGNNDIFQYLIFQSEKKTITTENIKSLINQQIQQVFSDVDLTKKQQNDYIGLINLLDEPINYYRGKNIDIIFNIDFIEEFIIKSTEVSLLKKTFKKNYKLFPFVKDYIASYILEQNTSILRKYYEIVYNECQADYLKRARILYQISESEPHYNSDVTYLLLLALINEIYYLNSDNDINNMLNEFSSINHRDKCIITYVYDYLKANDYNSFLADKLVELGVDYTFEPYRIIIDFIDCYRCILDYTIISKERLENKIDDLLTKAINDEIIIYNYSEIYFRLLIIITFAPSILDKLNDYNTYEKLAKKVTEIKDKNTNDIHIELLYHMFNRKCFLINTPDCAIANTMDSLNYFKRTNNYNELYMTSSGLIGLFTITKNYDGALKQYLMCINLKNRVKDVKIPFFKTINNIIIYSCLKNPTTLITERCLMSLRTLLSTANEVGKHVILTNLCSLSLRLDNINDYQKYKKDLEKLLAVKSITDISDENIDDFYIFFFLYFELFVAQKKRDKVSMEKIIENLENFCPTIFKKNKRIIKTKAELFSGILKESRVLSAQEYNYYSFKQQDCPSKEAEYFLMGLMLSDLQYTSFM